MSAIQGSPPPALSWACQADRFPDPSLPLSSMAIVSRPLQVMTPKGKHREAAARNGRARIQTRAFCLTSLYSAGPPEDSGVQRRRGKRRAGV